MKLIFFCHKSTEQKIEVSGLLYQTKIYIVKLFIKKIIHTYFRALISSSIKYIPVRAQFDWGSSFVWVIYPKKCCCSVASLILWAGASWGWRFHQRLQLLLQDYSSTCILHPNQSSPNPPIPSLHTYIFQRRIHYYYFTTFTFTL